MIGRSRLRKLVKKRLLCFNPLSLSIFLELGPNPSRALPPVRLFNVVAAIDISTNDELYRFTMAGLIFIVFVANPMLPQITYELFHRGSWVIKPYDIPA